MKHLISAVALLSCSAFAQAQSTHWAFSYTGFYDQEAGLFMPDLRLDGSFAGIDANLDGILERGELTSLKIGEMDYVACAGSSNAYYHCGADSFRFSTGEGLAFSLGETSSDPEGWVGGGHLITTGEMRYEYRFDPYSTSEHHLRWTEDTALYMVSTVPEVPAWAMLLVGVTGVFLKLRQRRGQSPAFHSKG
jgi:hypothetical protein